MGGVRLLRACTATLAVVGVVTTGTLLTVGTAGATGAAKTVVCTSLSGNLNTTPIIFTLGGCTPAGTGGGGKAQGSTITWTNGRQTYLTTPAFSLSGGKAKRGNCPALSDKWAVRDTVAGDTTGAIKSGGKLTASVCILNESPDPWSMAPGSVMKLR
jgi:hypothetical protein